VVAVAAAVFEQPLDEPADRAVRQFLDLLGEGVGVPAR
jgi:hypothetical protein